MNWAPRPAAWAMRASCFSIIACLIFSTGDVAGSHKVAWINPPRTIEAMAAAPKMTGKELRDTLSPIVALVPLRGGDLAVGDVNAAARPVLDRRALGNIGGRSARRRLQSVHGPCAGAGP